VGQAQRRPGRLARLVDRPGRRVVLLHGKDNIVFHAEIWPAMLLGYNGQGARGGSPGPLGR